MTLLEAFRAWLAQADLKVGIQITEHDTDSLGFRFDRGTECLRGFLLHRGSLGVRVEWDGEDQDGLVDLDCVAGPEAGGWVCRLCNLPRDVFPTLEALWEDHLFQPLQEWVNEKLEPATEIGIWRDEDGVSWAELIHSGNDDRNPRWRVPLIHL